MYCQYCGKENQDGDKFCFHCGKPFAGNVVPQPIAKPGKKNRLPWVVMGVSFGIVLVAAGIFGLYVFMGKDNSPQEADKSVASQVADTEAAEDGQGEAALPEESDTGDKKSGKEEASEDDIFAEGTEIDGKLEKKLNKKAKEKGKIKQNLVDTGLYWNYSPVYRVAFRAKASSQLKAKNHFYGVSNLWDLDGSTCWVEGKSGYGRGETITYTSKNKQLVSGIAILPGYLKSRSLFYKNSRPTQLDIKVGSEKIHINCSYFTPDFYSNNLEDNILYYDFGETIAAKKCTVKLTGVSPGSKYKDTCISEMFFYYYK